MNKHVLSFSDKINESIGVGSVLLIKGKQSSDGKYLYATTIQGHVEIKPGIKLVFIGDSIYRVINKGEDKFFGRKISHQSEEGLKGILNMKNPGKPSIVLNHNKTPFHWITLKHNDIGAALRELGPRLFSHDLILESDEEGIDADNIPDSEDTNISVEIDNWSQRFESDKNFKAKRSQELYNTICKELLLALHGKPSRLDNIKLTGTDDDNWQDEISEIEDKYKTFYWTMFLNIYIDSNKFKEFEKELAYYGIAEEFLDMLDIQSPIEVTISFDTDVRVTHEYDTGDWDTPPSGSSELESADHYISSIYIDEIPFKSDDMHDQVGEPHDLCIQLENIISSGEYDSHAIQAYFNHNLKKSNKSYLHLNGLDIVGFDAEEAKYIMQKQDVQTSGMFAHSANASLETKKAAKEIEEFWKKEIGVDKLDKSTLYQLQKIIIDIGFNQKRLDLTKVSPDHGPYGLSYLIKQLSILKEKLKDVVNSINIKTDSVIKDGNQGDFRHITKTIDNILV